MAIWGQKPYPDTRDKSVLNERSRKDGRERRGYNYSLSHPVIAVYPGGGFKLFQTLVSHAGERQEASGETYGGPAGAAAYAFIVNHRTVRCEIKRRKAFWGVNEGAETLKGQNSS